MLCIGIKMEHLSNVNFGDIYITDSYEKSTDTTTIGIRFGIPDNDDFACNSGDNW